MYGGSKFQSNNIENTGVININYFLNSLCVFSSLRSSVIIICFFFLQKNIKTFETVLHDPLTQSPMMIKTFLMEYTIKTIKYQNTIQVFVFTYRAYFVIFPEAAWEDALENTCS